MVCHCLKSVGVEGLWQRWAYQMTMLSVYMSTHFNFEPTDQFLQNLTWIICH